MIRFNYELEKGRVGTNSIIFNAFFLYYLTFKNNPKIVFCKTPCVDSILYVHKEIRVMGRNLPIRYYAPDDFFDTFDLIYQHILDTIEEKKIHYFYIYSISISQISQMGGHASENEYGIMMRSNYEF